jgi:glyoxylase-like metal-dependent hydrolase (beta-lactamase superfamily II)
MPFATCGPDLDRRALLRTGIGAAFGIWLAPISGFAQVGPPGGIRLSERAEVIIGLGGNIVLYVDDGAAVMVDSGAESEANRLTEIYDERTSSAGLRALFNTHWHLDQVGANAAFAARGAPIIAHRRTLAHLSIPYYLPDQDRYQPPLPPQAHPTETFFDEGAMDFASERIRYGYLLEAHTDGDIYVHFENENFIAAGDAISPMLDPVFDWYGGGWLGGRVDSLKLLLELGDAETRYVPSYGRVVDRAYVESELALMQGLYDILWERVRAGESAEDIHRSGALDALPRRFDDPARLLYDAHKSMWAHYNTLSPDIV